MRKRFKRFISFFLIPAVRWYLKKERKYSYRGIEVMVPPGVFHPGLFYSTRFLLDFILTQPVRDKKFLELGCGTGLISVMAARAGARVTASDVSQKAVKNASLNATRNNVTVTFVLSDLFAEIEKTHFDWIVINPPYYAKVAKTEEELAWNCGENFEYFHRLFDSLRDYMNSGTQVIMVLTLGCELEKIFAVGSGKGFEFEPILEKEVLFDEKDFLFRIRSALSLD